MDLYSELEAQLGVGLSPAGRVAECVLETPDFRRIRDLPWLDWRAAEDLQTLIEKLTLYCKTPNGEMVMLAVQAALLRALYEKKGAFGKLAVGEGKTLPSLLAAFLVRAKRPLLIVPAGLREKTIKDAYLLARHWKIPPITITSYELLSRDYGPGEKPGDDEKPGPEDHTHDHDPKWLQKSGKILGGLRPDLIIADEAHRLKNTRAACTRKVRRYIQGARKEFADAAQARGDKPEWPLGVYFLPMSGSFTSRSLRDYWHLAKWALGPATPMPLELEEFKVWCGALDKNPGRDGRFQPGALPRLAPNLSEVECIGDGCNAKYPLTLDRCPECGYAKDALVVARSAYAVRFDSAPGVISSGGDRPPMSLVITGVPLEAPEAIRTAIKTMRETWCTPDGHPFEMAVQLWQHARELQCGFYKVWDPRPPAEWLNARRDWSSFIRETLKYSRTYDSAGALVQAIDKGRVKDDGLLARWREIKDTFEENSVPRWIDDSTLQHAAKWLAGPKPDTRLCWVEHICFGERLSEMTGIPYFREQGCDPRGNLVDDHKGPAIVSIRSCSTGRNLQHKWHQNLYCSPTSVPEEWQQSLGRTHRRGQLEDEVTAEVLMMAAEAYSSLVSAIRGARYAQQSTRLPQKLLYATRDLGEVEKLINRSDDMWKSEVGV